MLRDTYYRCQYCGCRSRNRLKIAKHELKCKAIYLEQIYAESKIKNLLHYYTKLGYNVTVIYHGDDREIVSVKRSDYGKL